MAVHYDSGGVLRSFGELLSQTARNSESRLFPHVLRFLVCLSWKGLMPNDIPESN